MPEYHRAGYKYEADYRADQQVVHDTIRKLEDHFELKIIHLRFNPASGGCTAYSRLRKIHIGMNLLQIWGRKGYCEYKTLQYLIGLRWRRGEYFRAHHPDLVGNKAVQAIVCHEYAHLLSYSRYGKLGRGHQIMFQATVAEVYDFMFGPEFGATNRFLDKKGNKWLMEVKAHDTVQQHLEQIRGA